MFNQQDEPRSKLVLALESAINEALEAMTFEQPYPSEDDAAITGEAYWASLDIISPSKGTLHFVIPTDSALELTESVHGFPDDGETEESLVVDTVAEIINTIVGCFMSKLLSQDSTFDLGLPVTQKGAIPSLEKPVFSAIYMVLDRPINVTLTGEDFNDYSSTPTEGKA